MGRSTFISAALHTAILLWALVAFPASNMDRAPLVAVPVDLATQADVTKIKAGKTDAKDDVPLAGKPKEPKPEAAKEAEAKPPEQTAALDDKAKETPKPEDKADKPKDAEPKDAEKPAKPAKEAAADPPKKPKPPAPKKRVFNPDNIAALLNKIPEAGRACRRGPQKEGARAVERHGHGHVGE
jgi:outer membrane biosynthesis protein TonB